ncbi:MAG TPA: sugar phosphate nucleotidyltransferase [Verrucomicrobiae bacterium]|jgi:dTDP-glucose pyrophosphorylase|nr:sugar phosphate nucleotidyltransferase [Verrucomicrobiae bacterium]
MIKPSLLVLAAGMGSRYGGLKQIDPVGPNGETIIDYSIYDALRAGFGKLVFVIRRDLERPFRELVGQRFEQRLPVHYVFQELRDLPPGFVPPPNRTKPWGTAHALLAGQSAIQEPFAAINADDFYGAQSFSLLAGHLSSGSADYAMAGFVLRQTLSDFGSVARGVCEVDANGCMKSIVELTKIERDGDGAKNTDSAGRVTKLTGDEAVSMNCWGFTPAVFPALRAHFAAFLERSGKDEKAECYIPNAINELVVSGQACVRVLRTGAPWFGITYREDHARVVESIRQLIARGDYPQRLWG